MAFSGSPVEMLCVTSDSIEFLKKVPLFTGFATDDLLAVSRLLRARRYTKRTVLMHEGDPSAALYIIKKGSVAVTHLSSDGKDSSASRNQ